MPERQISNVDVIYGQVLVELADEAGILAEIAEQMKELGELIDREPGLRKLLSSKLLSIDERTGVLERLFKDRVHDIAYFFIQVVNRKDRLDRLPEIGLAFLDLFDKKRGLIEIDAYVAAPLDETLIGRVSTRLGEILGGTAVVRQVVSPDLIGGLKLRIYDRLIDGSVSAQLRRLRQKMISAGRDRAPEQVATMDN